MGPGRTRDPRRLPLTSRPLHCYVALSLFCQVLQSAISSWRRRVYRRNQFISDTKEINSGYHQPLGTCLESWVNSLGLFGGGC